MTFKLTGLLSATAIMAAVATASPASAQFYGPGDDGPPPFRHGWDGRPHWGPGDRWRHHHRWHDEGFDRHHGWRDGGGRGGRDRDDFGRGRDDGPRPHGPGPFRGDGD